VDITNLVNFGQLKGHYSAEPVVIWLVIKLGRDIMPLSIVTKFLEDPMKTV